VKWRFFANDNACMMTYMKCARGCCLLLGVALTLFHSLVPNAQEPVDDRSPKRSFTSQDGVFRFAYPDSLVLCKRDPTQSDWWTPDQSCEASIPVCSAVSGESGTTVACVAYPPSNIRTGANFQAGAFSVNRLKKASTARECLSVAEPPPHVRTPHTETINGLKFSVTEIDGVAAGCVLAGHVYRTFHAQRCYELGIRIVLSNIETDDPAPVEKFDVEEVQRSLKNVLESFKFLK
jgi:hypothetical protein